MSHILRVFVAAASSAVFPLAAMAGAASLPGVDSSISRSVTIPTANMPAGSEMWALWISLPAGKRVEWKEAKVAGTWMDLDMGLTGSTVSAPMQGAAPAGGCMIFKAQGQERYTGQETTTGPGDGFACQFGTGTPYWEENRGKDLYSRAQLNIGGPWTPDMVDTVDTYQGAGGSSKALRVDAISFRKVEEELRASGMMTATTRVVTMAPGSRSVTLDRYPTVRMVTDGELRWGTVPVDMAAPAMPKGMFKLGQFNWVDWTKPQQVVLSNESGEPAELVEWSIAPAPGTMP